MHFSKLAIVAFSLQVFALSDAGAAPYVPADGSQVIERLPSRNDSAQQDLQRLRSRLAVAPDDLQTAATLARRYIETGRSAGDPRYFGYAQAALAPWWNQPAPPNIVRILRATLRQSQHQFPEALADLDAVLQSDPANAQAWLTRATILQVQGDYAQAKSSCANLSGRAPELVVATCIAGAASLNGEAKQSLAQLDAVLKQSTEATPGIKVWSLTLLAEIAQRLGDHAAAETYFRNALALDPSDGYLLGAYADFLLDQRKAPQVLALLKNYLRPDGLLLRYALALKQQNSADAEKHIDVLGARFAAAQLRGDEAHEREQARFALHLLNKPQEALRFAQKNWSAQKEPADARILLEAAIASNDGAAAQPVLRWLRERGTEDRILHALAKKAEALS